MDRDKLLQIGAVALACFVAWAAFSMVDAPPMTRGELADWGQGLGSVAAVFIAAWVGTLPSRMEARARATRKVEFAMAIRDASKWIWLRIERLRYDINGRRQTDVILGVSAIKQIALEAVLSKFLEEPISQWPSVELYVRTSDLVTYFPTIFRYIPVPVAGSEARDFAESQKLNPYGDLEWRMLDGYLDYLATCFDRLDWAAKDVIQQSSAHAGR